jgi:DNA-binding CsgD family transcriptional regulator
LTRIDPPSTPELLDWIDPRRVHDLSEPLDRRVDRLLHDLRDHFAARQVGVLFLVRQRPIPDDVALGWRPAWIHSTRDASSLRRIKALARALQWVPRVDLPGRKAGFRDRPGASLLRTSELPSGSSHRWLGRLSNVAERIGVECPISPTICGLFLIDRDDSQAAFDPAELDVADRAAPFLVRALSPWATELGLTDGVLLSAREREVQRCLLMGATEAEGAETLGLRPSSFHQIVVKLYRKRGLHSRGELAARFLAPSVAAPDGQGVRALSVGLTADRGADDA